MIFHGQAVEKHRAVPLGLEAGNQLVGQGVVGDIAPGISLVHKEVVLINDLVKAQGGDIACPVIELVVVGVDKEGLIPRRPEYPGQRRHTAVGRRIAQAGEGLPRPQEGGRDAGEQFHLHVAGTPGVGVGQEDAAGERLRQGVEVGHRVGGKDTPGRRVGSKKLSDTTSTTLGLTAGSADCSASARS